MGSIDGWVDPEVKRMQDAIYGMVDESFEDRNRAKEGRLGGLQAKPTDGLHLQPIAIARPWPLSGLTRRHQFIWRDILRRPEKERFDHNIQALCAQ